MQQLVLTNIPINLYIYFTFITLLAKSRSTCFLHVKFCFYLQTSIALREGGLRKNLLNEEQTIYF